MTVGEYEERFRRPASSWHQILTLTQNSNQTRRRRWRCVVATALLAVMTLTLEFALHHAAHSPAGKGSARQPFFDVLPGNFWRILDGGGAEQAPLGMIFWCPLPGRAQRIVRRLQRTDPRTRRTAALGQN
jgi:hypothetical protein